MSKQMLPQYPADYTLYLGEMITEAGKLKNVAGWWAFFSGLAATIINAVVLRLVLRRLRVQKNPDMTLVSAILGIDLIYGVWVMIIQLIMAFTDYQILFNSKVFVQINGFVLPMLVLGSLFMVAVLSLERYMFTVEGVRWSSNSYYLLAAGYISPPVILGLVGLASFQFMPMPSCAYMLILVDKSSFGPIYLGFLTIQSVVAGLVFNASYLAILFHHRRALLQETLPDLPGQPQFQLRSKAESRAMADTLMYRTICIMVLYDCICLPEILAFMYEMATHIPRSPEWDFIATMAISNHALISPLVVALLHQPTKEDLIAWLGDFNIHWKRNFPSSSVSTSNKIPINSITSSSLTPSQA